MECFLAAKSAALIIAQIGGTSFISNCGVLLVVPPVSGTAAAIGNSGPNIAVASRDHASISIID